MQLAFPEAAAPAPPLSDSMAATGISIRPAVAGDIPFFRTLYASFRTLEMLMVPWTAEQKQAFLDDQFRLQHIHFTRYFAAADFLVVACASPPGAAEAIGRLYLDRSGPIWRIVDIGFLPQARGKGLGGAMLDWIKASARTAGAQGVALQVSTNNPRARALYLRAGFVDDGEEEVMHQPMTWRAAG